MALSWEASVARSSAWTVSVRLHGPRSMRATRNSKASRSSKPPRAAAGRLLAPALAFLLLLAFGAGAAAWVNAQGYTLDFGDAESHLNTARKILDSRTPG